MKSHRIYVFHTSTPTISFDVVPTRHSFVKVASVSDAIVGERRGAGIRSSAELFFSCDDFCYLSCSAGEARMFGWVFDSRFHHGAHSFKSEMIAL